MNVTRTLILPALAALPIFFSSCSLLDDIITTQQPTYDRMQGVWEVTEATNQSGDDIMNVISFPKAIFQLGSNNSLTSTAGPMGTYLVYGNNDYTKIATKVDQFFDYTKMEADDGEWFIDNGVVDRFTLYFKIQSLPGASTLQDLLGLLGIHTSLTRQVIYHKFKNVKVTFESDDVMIWELDYDTEAEYYTVDGQGEKVFLSLSTNKFSHCTFVLEKRVKDLQDLIKGATKK